jgi:hypothetical protein
MKDISQYIICHYAIANSQHALAKIDLSRVPPSACFEFFKLAIDKNNLGGLKALLDHVEKRDIY